MALTSLIYFDDASMPPEVFTDEGTAKARFKALRQNWSVHLFQSHAPEVCLCAAIKMPDGEVVRGHRHDNCYDVVRRRSYAMPMTDFARSEEYRIEIGKAEQGFLTSRGRFVDRREGMTLMRASGLPSHCREDGEYRGDELFSEDLYSNGPVTS